MIDVEAARTFLAVIETGTFQGAAEKVNVTQSTVSARIKTLEERLGQVVFERSKSGAQLTVHGYHFERYARAIVRAWEQGRQQAGVPKKFEELLVVGGQYNLWARFMTQWMIEMQANLPFVAFRAEAGTPLALARQLSEGIIDIAVLHQPRFRTDIEVEHLMDDELILVTTNKDGRFDDRYVYVDWGEDFRAFHAQKLPDFMEPRTSVSIGFFGARYLIASRAAGYMPRRMVESHLEEGYLFEAGDAPSFKYPVYMAWQGQSENPAYPKALALLRDLAGVAQRGELPPLFWSKGE